MFFNSVSRDRLYNADDFCLYFASLFDTGVLEKDMRLSMDTCMLIPKKNL